MRILLDESVPRDLGREFPGHEVRTVQQAGWAGLGNGDLLRQATGQFDVLITADRNLEYQQNLAKLPIPVVVLVATGNRIEDLRPLLPQLLKALDRVRSGELVNVRAGTES